MLRAGLRVFQETVEQPLYSHPSAHPSHQPLRPYAHRRRPPDLRRHREEQSAVVRLLGRLRSGTLASRVSIDLTTGSVKGGWGSLVFVGYPSFCRVP